MTSYSCSKQSSITFSNSDGIAVNNPNVIEHCSCDCNTRKLSCNKCINNVVVVMNPEIVIVPYARFYKVALKTIVIALLRKYILQTALALEYDRPVVPDTFLLFENTKERREVA